MARQVKPSPAEELVPAKPTKSLIERLAEWLDSNDWRHDTQPEKNCIWTGCNLKDVSVRSRLDIHDSDAWQRVQVMTYYPARTPEGRRGAMADAINRINHRLSFGNFEMDPEDGEVAFRTAAEAPSAMSEALIDRVFHGNLATADQHFAVLMAVAYGDAAPASVPDLIRPTEGPVLQ